MKNNLIEKRNFDFKIALVIGFLYIIAGCFDIGVSYHVFSKDPCYFLDYEGHQSIVGELKEGVDWFSTMSIRVTVLSWLCYLLFSLAYYNSPDDSKLLRLVFYLFVFSFTIMIFKHIYGGLSWFLY
jgi:hypothetical protein